MDSTLVGAPCYRTKSEEAHIVSASNIYLALVSVEDASRPTPEIVDYENSLQRLPYPDHQGVRIDNACTSPSVFMLY